MRKYVLDSLDKIPLGSFVDRPVTLNHKERTRKGFRNVGPTPLKTTQEKSVLFSEMYDKWSKKEWNFNFAG